MTLSGNVRLNILLCLSIALAVCQVLTVTALLILFKVYSDLKKKATECQKNLSMIEEQISRNEQRTETRSTTATLQSETKKKWHKEGEDSPTRVPTPLPSHRRSGYKQEAAQRTPSNSSQEMTGFPRDTSFTSARSRDSGTGSITTRTPQSSISFKSKLRCEDPLTEGWPTQLENRSMSWNEPKNQNEERDSLSSRLQTMAIEMIGLKEYDGLENEGFHGDNEESNKNLTLRSKKPDLYPESEQIRKDEMMKKWYKDEEERPTRVPTPPSSRRWKRNQNEEPDSRSSRLQTMAIGMIGMEDNDGFENERWSKDGEEYPVGFHSTSNRGSKINQNELENSHSSRRQKMAIEMIAVKENGRAEERKKKRVSSQLKQRKGAIDQVPSNLDDGEYVDTRF